MTLEYAILGFLNYKPLSGYELKKLFDNTVRHFWHADQSQIYRTLAQLAQQGLAEIEVVEQSVRPDRKVYHITPQGQQALHHWLKEDFPQERSRSAPLVKVFFLGQLSDDEILAKFNEAAAIFRHILEQYRQLPPQAQEYIDRVSSPREAYFWMLTLELGVKTMQAQLEWAENVIRYIEEQKLPQT